MGKKPAPPKVDDPCKGCDSFNFDSGCCPRWACSMSRRLPKYVNVDDMEKTVGKKKRKTGKG
jgi:hypothetical protein